MPRFTSNALTAALAACLLDASLAAPAIIEDPGLEAAFRAALDQPTGPLDTAAIASLTHLDARDRGIISLGGIEHATDLQVLDIGRNEIWSLGAIGDKPDLHTLVADGNQLTDIRHLATAAPGLASLDLSANRVGDAHLQYIAELRSLQSLDLRRNLLTDPSPIAPLPDLSTLALDDNLITSLGFFEPFAARPSTASISIDGNFVDLSVGSADAGRLAALRAAGVDLDPGTQQTASPVTFASTRLERDVRTTLRFQSPYPVPAEPAPLTTLDLAALRELEIEENESIDSLAGLEHAVNLTSLEIDEERLTDIAPVAGLVRLRTLQVSDCQLTDISPVAGLAALRKLTLYDNLIHDLSPVAGLTGLRSLVVGSNRIVDLSPLAALTELQHLNARYNDRIADLTPLSGLTNLTSVDLSVNAIADITPVAGLTHLTWLDLRANRITDLSPVAGLSKLTYLNVSGNRLTDLSPVAGLTRLENIEFERNAVTDLSPLTNLHALTVVAARNNTIASLTPLYGLPVLRNVALSQNNLALTTAERGFVNGLRDPDHGFLTQNTGATFTAAHFPDPEFYALVRERTGKHVTPVRESDVTGLIAILDYGSRFDVTDLTGIGRFTNLQQIILSHTSIADLSPLADLPNLNHLEIRHSDIADLSTLRSLPALERLRLSDNRITDLSPLAGNTTITEIDLSGNTVTDLTPLATVPNLRLLNLRDNPVINLEPLAALRGLKVLDLGGTTYDVSPLREVPLDSLRIHGGRVPDLSPIAQISDLALLDLIDLDIVELAPLGPLATHLRFLDLSRNHIHDLAPLAAFAALEDLTVADNPVDLTAPAQAAVVDDLNLRRLITTPLPAPADLTVSTSPDGTFLSWSTAYDYTYTIESSTDLQRWSPLDPPVSLREITHPVTVHLAPPSRTPRYYRITTTRRPGF